MHLRGGGRGGFICECVLILVKSDCAEMNVDTGDLRFLLKR